MNYIVSENTYSKRRDNRQQYIRVVEDNLSKKHGVTILTLCYNNNEQFFGLLDFLAQDSLYGDFAITIVQNSDNEVSLQEFDKRITNYKEVTVLYPKENVGSAGGYALGQEYILSEGYTHFIMIEDDVVLYDHNTVSATIAHTITTPQDVVFINAPINTGGSHSRYVQYACYPTSLIKIAGILDPRYYFRAEDLEWRVRIEHAIKHHKYKKHIINKNYSHPYIKPGNNSGSWIYFSVRNQLWTIRKYRSLSLWFVLIITQYIAYGLLMYIRGHKKVILANIYYALIDGIGEKKSLTYNKQMLKKLGLFNQASIQDIGFTSKEVDRAEILFNINVKSPISTTSISAADRKILIKHRGNIVALGGFQPVRGLIISCLPKVHIIEYIQLDKNILSGKTISQSAASRIINLLLFLPCGFLGGIAGLLYGLYMLPLQYIKRLNK